MGIPLLLLASDSYDIKVFNEGKKIYQQTCITCHGDNGKTNATMMLIVKPRKLQKTILTQEQSFKIIKEGGRHWGAHSDLMPAFKYVYDDKQILAVASYIHYAFNPRGDIKIQTLLNEAKTDVMSEEKMLKTGQKIFKRNCSLCHGITGNGESAYVEESKANEMFIYPYNLRRTLLDENQIFLYAKFGGHYWGADKTDMPAWKKKYSDKKLKSVARYVYQNIKQIKE